MNAKITVFDNVVYVERQLSFASKVIENGQVPPEAYQIPLTLQTAFAGVSETKAIATLRKIGLRIVEN